jgi:hypothetical protein
VTARRSAAMPVLTLLALLALGGLAASGTPASGESKTPLPGRRWTWSFDADTLGLAPAATRATGGRWAVLDDSSGVGAVAAAPPGGASGGASGGEAGSRRLLRQLESDDGIGYHVLQFLKPVLGDQEASVRFRIRSGEIDPSVGLAFQLDAKGRNGYLVRISGKDRELIAHYLLGGKRRDIKYARIDPPRTDAWHTLAVRREGSRLEIRYDGAMLIKLRDERFEKGNIGLWTEDDTVADFSDLTVTSL